LPDAAVIFKQARALVTKYHSLQYDTEMTIETTGENQPIKMTSRGSTAIVNPGKIRIEKKTQGMAMILVSDGEYTWVYNSLVKQYVRKPAVIGPAVAVFSTMGMPEILALPKISMSLRTMSESTVELAGEERQCWVVEGRVEKMEIPGAKSSQIVGMVVTVWIDKKLGLYLQWTNSWNSLVAGRTLHTEVRAINKSLKVDEPLSDSLFTFRPPADAKEVQEIVAAAPALGTDLTGQDSPAFEVRSLDGKVYSLASLKGKPVLLDFWATWCIPCRKSLPALENISRGYREQGLVILAVNGGEERETVEAFLKTSPVPYPVVLGIDTDILTAFGVTSYPTYVLIGVDGKIVAYQVGFGGEDDLRAMLSKAGLITPSTKPR
jgi:thiol-disulfide isomerase/thioredoxin